MAYQNMNEYVTTIYSVLLMVNNLADTKKDDKAKCIATIIYKYLIFLAKEYNIELKDKLNFVNENLSHINLVPFFEYISYNNIEFYDFNKIQIADVDTSNPRDLERFVLTHIYYITQK
jgi:hypothetical protein